MTDVRWVVSEYGVEGVHAFFRSGAHPEVSRATRCLWQAFFKESASEWPTAPNWRNDSVAPWIS
jgi:hypothetical protein